MINAEPGIISSCHPPKNENWMKKKIVFLINRCRSIEENNYNATSENETRPLKNDQELKGIMQWRNVQNGDRGREELETWRNRNSEIFCSNSFPLGWKRSTRSKGVEPLKKWILGNWRNNWKQNTDLVVFVFFVAWRSSSARRLAISSGPTDWHSRGGNWIGSYYWHNEIFPANARPSMIPGRGADRPE